MKKQWFSLFAVLLLAFTVAGCSTPTPKEDNPSTNQDEDPNIENNGPVDPMLSYEGVPRDHVITSVSYDEVMTQFEDGTGVLVLSFPNCPWCQTVMPVIDEVAKEMQHEDIYYLDVTTVTDTAQREAINELLDEKLAVEDGKVVMYVPDVYAIKDGEVMGHHLGAVSSYDPSEGPMSDEQKQELVKIYTDLFALTK